MKNDISRFFFFYAPSHYSGGVLWCHICRLFGSPSVCVHMSVCLVVLSYASLSLFLFPDDKWSECQWILTA